MLFLDSFASLVAVVKGVPLLLVAVSLETAAVKEVSEAVSFLALVLIFLELSF